MPNALTRENRGHDLPDLGTVLPPRPFDMVLSALVAWLEPPVRFANEPVLLVKLSLGVTRSLSKDLLIGLYRERLREEELIDHFCKKVITKTPEAL
jgi:hypothetical protein